jgi:hypothetical protein
MSQDTLYYNNGDTKAVLVYELMNNSYVRFRPYDDPEQTMQRVNVSELWKIKYHSGYTKQFRLTPNPAEVRIQSPASTGMAEYKSTYAGPRIGVTVIGDGAISDELEKQNKTPIMTQFGWQFETRFFKTTNGISGLFEFIPMIGGMEQGMFKPSASALIGMRFEKKTAWNSGWGPTSRKPALGSSSRPEPRSMSVKYTSP